MVRMRLILKFHLTILILYDIITYDILETYNRFEIYLNEEAGGV